MAYSNTEKKRIRNMDFGKLPPVLDVPYFWQFSLNPTVISEEAKSLADVGIGLHGPFKSVFPMVGFFWVARRLNYVRLSLGKPSY